MVAGVLAFGCASAQTELLQAGLTYVYGSPPAPELALPDLDHQTRRLADLTGKVVMVNFWPTWCPPCRTKMPATQRVYELLDRDRFEILAVNLGEEQTAIRDFLAEFELALRFPILLGQPEILEQWKVRGLPTSYLIDKQGRMIYSATGGRDVTSEHILERFQQMIDQ